MKPTSGSFRPWWDEGTHSQHVLGTSGPELRACPWLLLLCFSRGGLPVPTSRLSLWECQEREEAMAL